MYTPAEIVEKSKEHTLVSWSAQGTWTPIPMERAEGVYVYDANGTKYLDWSSQLVNVNIGHSHPHVVRAIQEQAAKLTYVEPSQTTEVRARLGELLAEVTPGDLSKTLFCNGGTDAIENAMKIAPVVYRQAKNPHALPFLSRRHFRRSQRWWRPAPPCERTGRALDRAPA
ncbi:aminotransferase class III-fold pyridoxal phosphate-dependent enzyme [bacterium]|nr:aminotransferase class III-fold pyridoxal phosphate-dependent enzyme [bacterium]